MDFVKVIDLRQNSTNICGSFVKLACTIMNDRGYFANADGIRAIDNPFNKYLSAFAFLTNNSMRNLLLHCS